MLFKKIVQLNMHLKIILPRIKTLFLKMFRFSKYSFIGIINKFIRKIIYFKKNFNTSEKVGVLGRGISVNKFFKESHNLFNRIFMINYEKKDLNFNDYLKLKNKRVSILSNICEPVPNIFLMLLWNIVDVVLVRSELDFKNNFKIRNIFRLNSIGVRVRGVYKSKTDNEYPLNLRNSGLVGIYEAAEYCKRRGIGALYLYGFDFYETIETKQNNLYDDLYNHEQVLDHLACKKRLIESFRNIASRYPKINFYITTITSYDFNDKNIFKIDFDN